MDAILGKLTNLAYEFFGVFVPGVVVCLFLFLLWFALGSLADARTALTAGLEAAREMAASRAGATGLVMCCLTLFYVAGQLVTWVSRVRGGHRTPLTGWSRIQAMLLFSVPRSDDHFDPNLRLLFESSSRVLGQGRLLEWREFYPVAKAVIAQEQRYSLVATYQNKYTLHRSLAVTAAGLFWASVFLLVACIVARRCGVPGNPNWALQAAVPPLSLFAVWGFSASYLYAWTMFGDTIVTETYALIFASREIASADAT